MKKNNYWQKIELGLQEINLMSFIIIMLLLSYIAPIPAGIICYFTGIDDIVWYSVGLDTLDGIVMSILSGIILAPALETLIFQTLPIDLLSEKPFL